MDISREADLTAPPSLATAIEVVSLPAATAASLHAQIFRGLLAAVVNGVEVNLVPSTRPLKPAF
jgi:hypothetical protein